MNECAQCTQFVRVLDVLVIGPLLVRAGFIYDDKLLIAIGVGTILYNARNWWYSYERKKI